MKQNAADLVRKALEGSTAALGYKVNLTRLKIHSIQIVGDKLVVDADHGGFERGVRNAGKHRSKSAGRRGDLPNTRPREEMGPSSLSRRSDH